MMGAQSSSKLPRCIDSSNVSKTRYTPNVLPCRVKHNGVVNASSRYWNPQTEADGSLIANFRGRKLMGRRLRVPEGCKGTVLKLTDRIKSQPQPESQQQAEGEEEEEEGEKMYEHEEADELQENLVMEEVAGFDDLVVWGHDIVPQDAEDPYIRGVEEWINFAAAMHSFDSPSPE